MTRLTPSYSGPSICSLTELAQALDMPLKDICEVASDSQCMYRQWLEPKKKGGYRVITSPLLILKDIQIRIKCRIFQRVEFPFYLQGGIPGASYRSNAQMHAGSSTIIKADIRDFFPSIQDIHVKVIWHEFFGCDIETADVLVKLTTFQRYVPQGAPTSTFIANLLLFQLEPTCYQSFFTKGLRYSRYIDDITVSKDTVIDDIEELEIRDQIQTMLSQMDLKLNEAKDEKAFRWQPMKVHGLNIDKQQPTVPKSVRHNLRSEVFKLKRDAASVTLSKDSLEAFRHQINVLRGKIANLTPLHPKLAKRFLDDLNAINLMIERGAVLDT